MTSICARTSALLAGVAALNGCGEGAVAEPSETRRSTGGAGATGAGGESQAASTGGSHASGSGAGEPGANLVTMPAPDAFELAADGWHMPDGLGLFDVTAAFYADHTDDYDFVVVWTDFVVEDFWQFTIATRVDVSGIGQDVVYGDYYGWPLDYWKEAGSAGRLQAVVFMNGPDLFSSAAFTAQEILTHEVAHRWGATFVLPSLDDPNQLLDEYWAHWPIVVGAGGPSALGYGETVDLGGGTFENHVVSPLRYAPLELYAMGLLPPDAPELGDMFWIDGPSSFQPPVDVVGAPWTKDSLNAKTPLSFEGVRVDLSVDQIVADLGPRLPAHADAQKGFRFAFVLLCAPQRGCSPEGVAWVDAQRSLWETTFSVATGGRATADTAL